jgi:adenosylcobinamide-GDP ribazoletransferase
MRSLILALRFLTVLPVPGPELPGPAALGRAGWWFPVVGLALGAGLGGLLRGLERLFPPLVAAVLLVAAWKIVTGGLHLDGLADLLDGVAGRDRAGRLAIMRDSRLGTFGALGLVFTIFMAIAAVSELEGSARPRVLLLAPFVGRVAPLLVGGWLRPATPGQGLGAAFISGLSRRAGPLWALVALVLGGALLGPGGVALAVAGLGVAVLAALVASRWLGGLTGDVLGAAVEVAELSVLLAGSALLRRGVW